MIHTSTLATEVYLVARGSASMRVETETVELIEGDALIVEPGEAHTFLASSQDYFDFVVHVFSTNARQFYGLERLWGAATTIEIASEPEPA